MSFGELVKCSFFIRVSESRLPLKMNYSLKVWERTILFSVNSGKKFKYNIVNVSDTLILRSLK